MSLFSWSIKSGEERRRRREGQVRWSEPTQVHLKSRDFAVLDVTWMLDAIMVRAERLFLEKIEKKKLLNINLFRRFASSFSLNLICCRVICIHRFFLVCVCCAILMFHDRADIEKCEIEEITRQRVKNSHNSPWKFNDSACVLSVTNWRSLLFW